METESGYFFDATETELGIIAWIIPSGGGKIFCVQDRSFTPSILIRGEEKKIQVFLRTLSRNESSIMARAALWHELYQGSVSCTEVSFHSPASLRYALKQISHYKDPSLSFYNIDLDPLQRYFYTKNLYPLCPVLLKEDESSGYQLEIPPENTAPPCDLSSLSILSIDLSPDGIVLREGSQERLLQESGQSLKRHLEKLFREQDPDIIFSSGGDQEIFPFCARIGFKEPHRPHPGKTAKRDPRKEGVQMDGRWHLDKKSSFFLKESGVEGLLEVSRIAKTDIHRLARSTPGNAISSAQLALAFQKKILIPWKKDRLEQFSTAEDLLRKDRGGMVLVPRSGVHNKIAEIDFSSMYPSIMVRKNISPETINQSCCPGIPVPNSPHRICHCRKGFIPEVLDPVLKKRLELKRLKKLLPEGPEREKVESRQKALKWLLVVCFGYLGYHHARFGSVEAHECVTAWGRETLLQARDIVEESGYRVIHGIVDALWFGPVHPEQTSQLEQMNKTIQEKTEIEVTLEGVYDWIAFPPGAADRERGSATRYFGKISPETIKARGILSRQKSTPPFIRALQEDLLMFMGKFRSAEEVSDAVPALFERSQEWIWKLTERRVPLSDLLITVHLSKPLSGYQKMTDYVVAAQKREGSRTDQSAVKYWLAGRQSHYRGDHVVSEGSQEIPVIDLHEYEKLAEKAIMELLSPFIKPPDIRR